MSSASRFCVRTVGNGESRGDEDCDIETMFVVVGGLFAAFGT